MRGRAEQRHADESKHPSVTTRRKSSISSNARRTARSWRDPRPPMLRRVFPQLPAGGLRHRLHRRTRQGGRPTPRLPSCSAAQARKKKQGTSGGGRRGGAQERSVAPAVVGVVGPQVGIESTPCHDDRRGSLRLRPSLLQLLRTAAAKVEGCCETTMRCLSVCPPAPVCLVCHRAHTCVFVVVAHDQQHIGIRAANCLTRPHGLIPGLSP